MGPCGDAGSPATIDCFFSVIFPNVFNAALSLVGIVVVVLIIVGGMRFILSRGDNKQLEGAKKTLTYAIIGLVVVLFAVFIVNFIGYVTGVTCIHFFGYDTCTK